MTALYDAIFSALDQYPGWDDSAIGYGLKNDENERRKIARAVHTVTLPLLDDAYAQRDVVVAAARILADDLRQDKLDAERDKVTALHDLLEKMTQALDLVGEEHNDAAFDTLLVRARAVLRGNYDA